MGRPSSYKPEYANQAAKLCKLGATDKELADFFSTSEQTINKWKMDFPDFLESLKLGKAESDGRVEKSLYRRALGYSHDEVHISNYLGDVTLTPIVKHYPPDTTACIFWLKNRKPAEWRDKIDIDDGINRDRVTKLLELVEGRLGELEVASQGPATTTGQSAKAH